MRASLLLGLVTVSLLLAIAGVRPTAAQTPSVPADTAAVPVTPQPPPAPADTLLPPATQPAPAAPADALASPVVNDTLPTAPLPADSIDAAPPEAAADTLAPERPPLSQSADSVFQALRRLQGFTVTEYRGDQAIYSSEDGVLRLEGDAEVIREGDRLTADTIVYRERLELVEAYGNPEVSGEEQELQGDVLYYDLARRRATALGARTQVTEAATWYVTGDVTLEGTERLFGRNAHFTSCDLVIPHYHFEADKVMVVRDRILVARPARLYFGNVPVMVLPFVVQNLEQGRRSGFLTPRFGVHDIVRTSSGYNRQISDVGFYWAINQYLGAQVSTTWRSGAYTSVLGTVDYRWRQQFLNGNLAVERYWQAEGGREFSLNTSTSWQPDERTNLAMSGSYASSSAFVRDASYDPRDVTQDLRSSFSLNRRFGWGTTSLGADRRQSIATGDVSMTLPSLSISLPSRTLFRSPTPEQARWFNNVNFTPGPLSASRSSNEFADNIGAPQQDRQLTRLRLGPSLSVGNFSINTTGELNRDEIREATGETEEGEILVLPAANRDEARWSTAASYRQNLIGTTSIAPNISLSQQLVRDTVTGNEFLGAPVRLSFGVGLNTDLYGFFPGVGGYSAIRHRLSPRLSYSYAPAVMQTALQDTIFGKAGGRAQNRVSFGINQSWEAKLRDPRPVTRNEPFDSIAGDTVPQANVPSVPSDPQKVTLLSLTTSALEYDFIQAREEGSGFVTNQVSNTVTSDYLRGLTIQMQHELFDRTQLDPGIPENAGELGRFAPRLSSLSTSFQIGPESALLRWVERLANIPRRSSLAPGEDVFPGTPPSDEPAPAGTGAATGNPQTTGAGSWNLSLGYRFSRPSRIFSPVGRLNDDSVQTLDGNLDFQLSPNWSVNWTTSYSITDTQFGSHRLNFQRDLHEWQANFSFYQTPNGNSAFEFYVELTHNRDLRFDYAERNLGIDRRR